MVHVEHEPRQLIVGAVLMVSTAVIQTFAVVLLEELVLLWRDSVVEKTTRLRMVAMLSGIIIYLFALHLLQMSVWAAFYLQVTTYPSFAVALYESGLAFTTMDVADLPPAWKFLSAAEGVAGLLMFAWSTSVLFAQTSWITEARHKYLRKAHMFGSVVESRT